MKKIVIVGASSGMGMRIAMDFARAGWRVGVAARSEDRLQFIKQQFPDRVEYSVIDVTADDAANRFEDLIESIGGMDIVLYAAGVGWNNPDLDLADDVQTTMVNVAGFTKICNAAYRYYKHTANTTRGRIAAITSVAGGKGIGIAASYSASKRYQWSYLQALDQLAHQQHVNVGITDIRPGFVRTPLLAEGKDYPMLMSVDQVAPLIRRAILRGKRIATIDSRWRIVSSLWKLVPGAIWRHIGLKF